MIRLFLPFLLSVQTAFTNTYYVSGNGSGTTCSRASPCALGYIGQISNPKALVGGDRVRALASGGTFDGPFAWFVSGANGNPIILEAEPGHVPVIDNPANTTLNYGSEVLANGSLTGGTSWTPTGGFALVSNAATYTHSDGSGSLYRDIAIIPTTLYRLTYTISGAAGSQSCSLDTDLARVTESMPTTNGTHAVYFQAGVFTFPRPNPYAATFRMSCTSTSGAFTVDDFSVRSRMPNANLSIAGNDVRVQGFEIYNSSGERDFSGINPAALGGACYPNCFADGIFVGGQRVQIRHNIIHDVGQGVAAQNRSEGLEIYGNLIYYIGWQGDVRGVGHNLYLQNSCAADKVIEKNVIWWGHANNIQTTGGAGSNVSCIKIRRNVAFQPGALGSSPDGPGGSNLIMGGNPDTSANNEVSNNRMWGDIALSRVGAYQAAYQSGQAIESVTVTDNLVKSAQGIRMDGSITSLTRSGNRWYGRHDTNAQAAFVGDIFGSYSADTTDRVYEETSTHDTSWGYLAVFNNDGNTTASFTPACSSGTVELREIMNHSGAPVQVFPCDGFAHTVQMDYSGPVLAAFPPVAKAPTHTGTTFRVFKLTFNPSGNAFVAKATGSTASARMKPPRTGPH